MARGTDRGLAKLSGENLPRHFVLLLYVFTVGVVLAAYVILRVHTS